MFADAEKINNSLEFHLPCLTHGPACWAEIHRLSPPKNTAFLALLRQAIAHMHICILYVGALTREIVML